MALPEWVMVVDLAVDREILDDWNRWYDEVHLQEVAACPGFERVTRYIAPAPDPGSEAERHLTIYELSDASAMDTPEFAAARGLGGFDDHVTVHTRLFRRHIEYDAPS